MRLIQKVLSLTQKEAPQLSIFVMATHYHLQKNECRVALISVQVWLIQGGELGEKS